MSNKLVFIHGGPGLNSEPERRALDADLRHDGWDPTWWNEPSAKRGKFYPDQAWTEWSDSAARSIVASGPDVTVVASSFGAQAVDHILAQGLPNVKTVVYVNPALDIYDVTKRMFRAAFKDFDKQGDTEKATQMADMIARTTTFNDTAMKLGLQVALQDPALFGNYWKNMDGMAVWGAVLAEADWGFDFGNMQAVYAELMKGYENFERVSRTWIPTLVILGENDPVVTEDYTTEILGDRYVNKKIVKYTESAHFSHLEEKDRFRADLRDLLR